MANAGASIEAILTLDASRFNQGVTKAIESLSKFQQSSIGVERLNSALIELESSLSSVGAVSKSNLNTFSRLSTAINKMANGLKILQSDTLNVEQAVNTMNSIFKAFQGTLGSVTVKLDGVAVAEEKVASTTRMSVAEQQKRIATLNANRNSVMGLITGNNQLSSSEDRVSTSTSKATSSVQRQSVANRSATASTNQLTSATSRLGKAMSSLRMMGSLVGSMLAYNFAHKLLVATGETIHAKSEMEGYFKMLHFGQGEIDKFNSALDETVKRFQRVNKYSLGETISSIGVEFNLTTDEMIKAMDVTSMITSEYLRAGRNANEASLAVKDVLQGQFQRLSRETGVKGEQLKEAGWNGDVTDVNSLLDALRKVGEDRNWDVFAEKANSLNDILTILQNRFGEWSADMVNIVQPSIVNAFNAIMSVGGALSGVLEGMWTWINGDGLVETATRWTMVGSAIIGVSSALITYRTGANLVQMAQMGLRGSIMATIFGLKAEEVATYGSRNALIAKITSLKAEQVATMGVRNAILAKALGLNTELTAQKGLKGAIMASTFAKQLEKASTEGANAEEMKSIYLKQQSQLANMGTLKAIIARVAGVNMETFAERGLIVALAQRIAQSPLYIGSLKAEEVAELSTAEAGMILMGTLTPLIAIFIGLAVAVYGVVKPLQDASEEMKSFNNIVQNGDDIVKSHRKTYDSLSKSYSEGQTELSKLTKGTDEYIRKEKELEVLQKDVETAQNNVTNSYKAYQRAVSAQTSFEEESGKIRIHTQTELADAYIKAGFSAQQASEMASNELQEAERGAEQLREALQMLKLESDKHIEKNSKTIDMLDQYGVSDDKIREFGTNLSSAQQKIDEGLEKFMTSEDLMDRVGGWFEIQQGRFEEWWTELNAFFEVRDWEGIGQKLLEGFNYITDWIFPWKQNIIDGLKAIEDDGLIKAITDALFGEGDADGVWDIASQFFDECVSQPIQRWWSWFWQDPIGNILKTHDSLSTMTAKFLFGKDEDRSIDEMLADWFNDNVSKPIADWFNGFLNDPLSYIGNAIQSVGSMFIDGIGKLLFGDGFDTNEAIEIFKSYLADFNILDIIWDAIFGEDVYASGGSSDHPDVATEMYQVIVQPIVDWWNGFMADPLSYIGNAMQYTGIGSLISALMGVTDGMDFSWAWEWLNNTVIIPLQTQMNMFLADPLSYIGGAVMGTGIGGLINALIPNDGGVSILNWVNTAIIQPMTLGIQTGIASIPILGDIAMMLGLVPQQNQNAYTTGYNLIDNLKRGVEQKISEIPIIGDIAKMLGLIPQENGNAHDKGHGIGDNIKQGEQSGHKGTAQNVASEMSDVVTAISNSISNAFSTAQQVGNAIWDGINSVLQRHSPGFIHDQVMAEFGTDIPNAILSGGDSAYANAQYYGEQIKDGISSVNLNSFGSFATDYEADTQMINASTEMMGMDTTTAFNDMSMAVNSTTNTMGSNVISTYTSMQTKQASSLNTMKQQNLSAYNDMYLKSNQSLVHMRDSTSNVTHQMTNAWNTMKNNIVESANRLKHDSTVHFNTLSNTIGGFYRKIQNPSSWGGSPHGGSTHRNVTAGRRIASSFTGGRKYSGGRGSTYDGRNTMTIAQLKKKICPSGDCNGIFDGWSATDVVDVRTFLSMVEDGGFGSWSDWHNTHYNHIKSTSDTWGMKSPTIQLKGGIPTNADYKVGDFESGSPKISFASFQSMAESIFSAIPYRFYYNSDWKGSWLGALQAGACNCWDGAHAILAFANSCGFGGSIAHGSWVDPDGTTYPHVWAVINGKKMDTTGWQQRGSWSAGSPNARIGNATRVRTNDNNTQPPININVTIDGDVYGVDDLDSKIADGVDKGLSKHFNKSYAIGV